MMRFVSHHYNLLMATAAFLVWGSWAGYVNAPSGVVQGSISALTQGVMSAASTLMMIWVIEYLYRRLEGLRLRSLLPAIALTLTLGLVFVLVHRIAGTHQIAQTVMPNLVIVFVFGLITTIKVRRAAT